MGDAATYVKDVWKQKGVVPVYPPGYRVGIGDVATFKNGKMSVLFNLKDRGVALPVVKDSEGDPWTTQSERGVSVSAKLKGSIPKGLVLEVLGEADVGAIIKMEGKSRFAVSLADVRWHRLRDRTTLDRALRKMFWSFGARAWDTSWRVVTEVGEAASGAVVLSSSEKSHFEFQANAKVKVADTVGLVDLAAGFKLVNSHDGSDQFTIAKKFTPVVSLVKLGVFGVRTAGGRRVAVEDLKSRTGQAITPRSVGVDSLEFRLEPIDGVDDLI